ncbi:MAG: (E)-4-hydroxy-3-methylbut-2-enyl-diphosphate synthase [Paramuribaculum sp.]|nr:(E)-4-hydroxy-3-methylbut-2-enyl-diphosphate synthase [Paramuribaculum sp.]
MGGLDYKRRETTEAKVAGVGIGGSNPIRIQTMTNTSTMNTEGSVDQIIRTIEAGAELVRLTAQGTRESTNIGLIRKILRDKGYFTPIVADIHFNPKAAYAAIGNADKIRINPGNFADPGRTFTKLEYTDEEYSAELQKIEAAVTPFIRECAENGTAIRVGVNHGSLSDRIMSRYGDTPAGMAESAMEFLRICQKTGFKDVVVSIKASNVVVMVETVRLLVKEMDKENMKFPIHLGVTEAGDGEDGRIKSAVGIGTLLLDGIGDTVRVSLSEDPEKELPVARRLIEIIEDVSSAPSLGDKSHKIPKKLKSTVFGNIGGGNAPVVIGDYEDDINQRPDYSRNEASEWYQLNIPFSQDDLKGIVDDKPIVLFSRHKNLRGDIRSAIAELQEYGINNPIILKVRYEGRPKDDIMLRASVELGSLLLDGLGDGVFIDASALSSKEISELSFKILQSTRLRITQTEYIACPGCGRTLFDLQKTLGRIKEATKELKGLKIGVMGCIVNGPGEMADADYGYVGAGKGRVSLYRGKECVEKNISEEKAVEKLLELIERDKKQHEDIER